MKSGGQWDGLILYDANMFAMRKMGATYFRCCCKRTGAGIMGMNCCQILRNGWVVVLLYPSMRFHPPCQGTDVRTDWRNRHSLSASSAANIFILSVIDSLCRVVTSLDSHIAYCSVRVIFTSHNLEFSHHLNLGICWLTLEWDMRGPSWWLSYLKKIMLYEIIIPCNFIGVLHIILSV